MIYRNKNRAGRASNVVFGMLEVLDGLVRVCSLGFLHTALLTNYSRRQARRAINALKEGIS